uniref:Uncharacterized protein n=1 Tax=Caudovirales sp. ctCpR1 TaxID=2825760 RepID=A0A8S5V9C3_9CAUD|nr:MAG TPA: hypothetical protein [Caudovirales sp. ctCpR1]
MPVLPIHEVLLRKSVCEQRIPPVLGVLRK